MQICDQLEFPIPSKVPRGRPENQLPTNQQTTKHAADFSGLIRQIRVIRGQTSSTSITCRE